MSIPRLELLAVLLGVRATKFTQQALHKYNIENKNIHIWTDSTCVQHWIKNDSIIYKRFVENRIHEIRQHKYQIHYVPSKDNPADILSRGSNPKSLKYNTLWWNGPNWLTNKEKWPQSPIQNRIKEEENKEIQTITLNTQILQRHQPLFNFEQFSSWNKLLNVTLKIKLFISKLKHTKIIKTAEYILLTDLQLQHPPSEKQRKEWNIKSDQDNLLRCYGDRFSNLENYTPLIYLPRTYATKLIIQHIHQKIAHSGTSHTLNELRTTFWLPKGRQLVKQVIKRCVVCKRFTTRSFTLPKMPELPEARINRCTPFTQTGVDYFGPMVVKNNEKEQKVWVAIFTCFTIRAIHLEYVDNLTALSFINTWRRFIARKGTPRYILSDNATYFQLTEKIFQDETVKHFFDSKNIHWSFTTQHAPWKGAVYERLIKIIKSNIHRVIGKSKLNLENFITLLTEIEIIVNSRPISYVGEEIGQILRPINLLQPEFNNGFFVINKEEEEYIPNSNNKEELLLKLQTATQKIEKFWKLWKNDYLNLLRKNTQHYHKDKQNTNQPQEGDIVLIEDQCLPRSMWKLGRIEHLIHSKDKHVRSAQVKTCNQKLCVRPLSSLYPLEL